MNRCNLYALARGEINYLPVSSLETVANNKDGVVRDFTFPEDLLRITIQNAFLIYQAQHGSLSLR